MLWIGGSSFFIPLLVPYSCVILEENSISSVPCVSVADMDRRMSSFPQFPTFLCLFFLLFNS